MVASATAAAAVTANADATAAAVIVILWSLARHPYVPCVSPVIVNDEKEGFILGSLWKKRRS